MIGAFVECDPVCARLTGRRHRHLYRHDAECVADRERCIGGIEIDVYRGVGCEAALLTVTMTLGCPLAGVNAALGVTAKEPALVAVPPAVVMLIGPVPVAGAVAVSEVAVPPVKVAVVPSNFTALGLVSAVPVMTTACQWARKSARMR